MGSSTSFYCGPADNAALEGFASSIGLLLVPPLPGTGVPENPADGPFCYLSVLQEDKLSPYGEGIMKVSPAVDPLLGLLRSYVKGPYLVAGQLFWSNDVPELAKITKPYYAKMVGWMRKEWEKYGDVYIGPEARVRLDEGVERVNILPASATMKIIKL